MTTMTQADFARTHGVSRSAVTQWKERGSIVLIGDLVDVETSDGLLKGRRKGRFNVRKPTGQRRELNEPARKAVAPLYAREPVAPATALPLVIGIGIGNSPKPSLGPWQAPTTIYSATGLPTEISEIASFINDGAADMAVVMLRGGLALEVVQPLVDAWVTEMRHGHASCFDDGDPDAPAPPYGYERWADHPLFTRDWMDELAASWEELKAEAAQPPRRFW